MPATNQLSEILLVPGQRSLPSLGWESDTGIWGSPQTVPVNHVAVILSVKGVDGLSVFSDRVSVAFPMALLEVLTATGGTNLWAPAMVTGPVTHVPVWTASPQTDPALVRSVTLAEFAALMPPGPAGPPSTVPGPAGPGLPSGGSVGNLIRKSSALDFVTEWFAPSYVTGSGGTSGVLPVWSGAQALLNSRLPNPPQDATARLFAYRAASADVAGAWEAFTPGGAGLSGGTTNRLALWSSPTTLTSQAAGTGAQVLKWGLPPVWGSVAWGELTGVPTDLAGYGLSGTVFTKTETIAAINASYPKLNDPKAEGGGTWADFERAVFKVSTGWVVESTGGGGLTGGTTNRLALWSSPTTLTSQVAGSGTQVLKWGLPPVWADEAAAWLPGKPPTPAAVTPYVLVLDTAGNPTWRALVGTGVVITTT